MPTLTKSERLARARFDIASARNELKCPPGRDHTYAIIRARKYLLRVRNTLSPLTRKHDPDALALMHTAESIWP